RSRNAGIVNGRTGLVATDGASRGLTAVGAATADAHKRPADAPQGLLRAGALRAAVARVALLRSAPRERAERAYPCQRSPPWCGRACHALVHRSVLPQCGLVCTSPART